MGRAQSLQAKLGTENEEPIGRQTVPVQEVGTSDSPRRERIPAVPIMDGGAVGAHSLRRFRLDGSFLSPPLMEVGTVEKRKT